MVFCIKPNLFPILLYFCSSKKKKMPSIRTYNPSTTSPVSTHSTASYDIIARGDDVHIVSVTVFCLYCTFSTKERDTEIGYSVTSLRSVSSSSLSQCQTSLAWHSLIRRFGSRYYTSDLSIWLSVDPMSDKYPSLSPYVYCANNPVKLVDPNGEEWIIDGYKYYPGQNCPDDAQQSTKDKWNAMNTIYSTKEGKDVIDYMNKEGVWYCVSSESCSSEIAGGEYVSDGDKTGGTIFLNGGADIGTLAHEIFHGYQDQKGQGNASQHNELQARLFSDDITNQVQFIVATGRPQLQITEQGIAADLFNYNVGKVRSGSYSDINMGQLEDLFSSFERFKGYRNLPIKIDGQTNLYGELKNR